MKKESEILSLKLNDDDNDCFENDEYNSNSTHYPLNSITGDTKYLSGGLIGGLFY